LRENHYSSISYGDSPGHPGNPEKTARICGIKEVAERYNLSFGDFSKGKTIEFPEGKTANSFEICNAALDCDVIINICKMKTHQLERITGAVKNMLGCVCGIQKAKMHVKYPNPDSFGKMLIDLNLLLKPRLHIMDGIIAMEGNGPMSGDKVQMNCILISTDPVALDSIFCRLINLDTELVPTIKFAQEYKLGNSDESNIEIFGDDISQLINSKFNVERGSVKIRKGSMAGIVKTYFAKRPYIINRQCKRCGICIQSCPIDEKAIYYPDSKCKKAPKFIYDKCIRCYCCQELCPEKAIIVKTPVLGKFIIPTLMS
jgi:uncharacterized protein (DUF362 family)/NAD-dependent dihydropyrimidine dehydrogenase PreA subunit